MTRRTLFASFVPAIAAVSVQSRTDDVAEKKLSVFEKAFPKPTGTNGFEEITRAGEKVRSVAGQYYLPPGESTLARKREYLALPECQEALSLLRAGLSKPLRFPRPDFETEDDEVHVNLRWLARLLATGVYVACADGRSDNAVRLASDAVAYAYPLKEVSVTGALVGTAVDAIVLSSLVKLRDSWTVSDCSRLIRLVKQNLAKPDGTRAALHGGEANSLNMIALWRERGGEMCDELEKRYQPFEDYPEPAQYRESLKYAAVLRTDPAARERILNELIAVTTEHYRRAAALITDPTGRMTIAPPGSADADRHPAIPLLRDTFLPDVRKAVQRTIMGRVNLQLVAIHAALRSFRWESDRLPKTLDELDLPVSLLTDPFTAKPLLYEPEKSGFGYDLASAGALFPGEKGKPDFRERITFPWTKPK